MALDFPLTAHHVPPAASRSVSQQFDLFAFGLLLILIALLPFHAFFRTWLTHLFTESTADAISRGGLLIAIWKEILLATAIGLVGLKAIIERKLPFKLLPLDWCIVALALIGLATRFFTEIPLSQWLWGVRTDFAFFGMYLVGRSVTWNDGRIRKLLRVLIISGSIVIAFGLLLKFVLPADTLTHFGYSPYISSYVDTKPIPVYHCEFVKEACIPRLASTLSGPNQYGTYLLFLIGITIVSLRKKTANRLLYFVLLGTALISLYFTYSQGAWVGLLGMFVLLGLSYVKYTRVFLRDMSFVTIGLLILVLVARPWVLLKHVQDPSTVMHIDKFREGVNVIIQHPWGLGLGGAGPVSERFYGDTRGIISESWYLQIGQEMGILGGIVFLALVFFALQHLWIRARSGTDTRIQILTLGTLLGFAGVSIVAVVLHVWADSTTSWIVFAFAGAVMSAADQSRLTTVLKSPGVAAFSGNPKF